jgi:hypothetical protein
MATTFIGRGLGIVAVAVPLAVVTPAAIVSTGETAAETYRLLSESGDVITDEATNPIRSE